MSQFRIVISTTEKNEYPIAELFFKDNQWAEISLENSQLFLTTFPHPTKDHWDFPFEAALEALRTAKHKLLS